MILNFLKGFRVNGKRKETDFENKIKSGRKVHTIRRDEKDRWCIGRKIHFSTGSRTNNYNCFKHGVCTGIQYIDIFDRTIFVDNYRLSEINIEELAINDGFNDVDDFWAWFDQYSPFDGKIIHWTNKRY